VARPGPSRSRRSVRRNDRQCADLPGGQRLGRGPDHLRSIGPVRRGARRAEGLGEEVTTDTVSGQDVTEEYVDLQSRERNLLAAEQSLLDLYNRADDVQDALSIQRELTGIKGQIEQVQGRMQYLKQSSDTSQISLSISPVASPRNRRPPGTRPSSLRSVDGLACRLTSPGRRDPLDARVRVVDHPSARPGSLVAETQAQASGLRGAGPRAFPRRALSGLALQSYSRRYDPLHVVA
jgi:hypothetical protein